MEYPVLRRVNQALTNRAHYSTFSSWTLAAQGCLYASSPYAFMSRSFASFTNKRTRLHNDKRHCNTHSCDRQLQRNYSTPTATTATSSASSLRDISNAILSHPSIPTETQVLSVLSTIERLAQRLIDSKVPTTTPSSGSASAASEILSLDSRKSATTDIRLSSEEIDYLSDLAYQIVKHPPVFISPKILTTYTHIQCLLTRPATLPEVFDLYAVKPSPSVKHNSSPREITYKSTSSNAIAAAVSTNVATEALSTAIRARDLSNALSIINTSFRTTAYQRARIFRRALPPIIGASLSPIAAYTVASQLSIMQNSIPPENFTSIAFAGILTYTACVGTIGYVALTTANDQMERVTWAIGMPLWERWVREDERAALDKVARAWGLREKWRWGEEEGEEWEALKEWIGVRGMILDKVGLMEGME